MPLGFLVFLLVVNALTGITNVAIYLFRRTVEDDKMGNLRVGAFSFLTMGAIFFIYVMFG